MLYVHVTLGGGGGGNTMQIVYCMLTCMCHVTLLCLLFVMTGIVRMYDCIRAIQSQLLFRSETRFEGRLVLIH